MASNERRFDGVIFDMDGTLTVPRLDFGAIRREIGLQGGDLTEEIPKLPPERQRQAWTIIEEHEERAMREQQLQQGAAELIGDCRRSGIKLGVITRNAQPSVDHLCQRYGLVFDAVITREFPALKPHPEPALHMIRKWDLPAQGVLMVGDYLHDIDCGRAAGTKTCFFQNPDTAFWGNDADYVVHSMAELARVIFDSDGA